MSADDIIAIINAIPQYIEYFYPGYITIYIYYFFRAKHVPDTKAVILKALGISYVYSVILSKVNDGSTMMYNFWLIILSVMVAYMAYLFTKSETTERIFRILNVETCFWDNEIEALQGLDVGAWLVVYLIDEDVVYEGWLHFKEMEPNRRQYITLTNFRKYLISNETGKPVEPYIEMHDEDAEEEVTIFYNKIKRIEKRKV